jgi:hypothetical protein
VSWTAHFTRAADKISHSFYGRVYRSPIYHPLRPLVFGAEREQPGARTRAGRVIGKPAQAAHLLIITLPDDGPST